MPVATAPDPPDIRATDDDRERAAVALADASAAGSLTFEELAERVGRAHAARTRAELAVLTADLPAAVPPSVPAAPVRHRAIASRLSLRGHWTLPPRPSFLCLAGTLEIDLREVSGAGPALDLELTNWFGTVTVVVPEGTRVELDPGGISATHDVRAGGPPAPGAPTVRLRTRGGFGTTRVRSRPR